MIRIKVHACAQCGRTDSVKVGQTSVGCHTCNLFCVGTDTLLAVYTWNTHNPINQRGQYE